MVAPERLGGCLQGASWLESSSLSNPSLEGKRFLELGKEEDFHPELESLDGDLDPGLPSTEDVILKTEQVTKNIQDCGQPRNSSTTGMEVGRGSLGPRGCCRGQGRDQCAAVLGPFPHLPFPHRPASCPAQRRSIWL